MTRTFERLDDLAALEGQTLGTSDWTLVDQARIDLFAQATGAPRRLRRRRASPF